MRGCLMTGSMGLLVALALLAGGCATRGAPVEEPAIQAMLAFLAQAPATRAVVEERLGPPHATFEAGRIVAYRPRQVRVPEPPATFGGREQWRWEWTFRNAEGTDPPALHLMIEYDASGKVVRHVLLQ